MPESSAAASTEVRGSRSTPERLGQSQVGDLGGQASRHQLGELAVGGSAHRQGADLGQRFESVAIANGGGEQRLFVCGVTVEGAFRQTEDVCNVLHLGAPIAVGHKDAHRGLDDGGQSVWRNGACHPSIITDRLSQSRMTSTPFTLGSRGRTG